jgi:hypothetical protein
MPAIPQIYPLTGTLSNLDAFLGSLLEDEKKDKAQSMCGREMENSESVGFSLPLFSINHWNTTNTTYGVNDITKPSILSSLAAPTIIEPSIPEPSPSAPFSLVALNTGMHTNTLPPSTFSHIQPRQQALKLDNQSAHPYGPQGANPFHSFTNGGLQIQTSFNSAPLLCSSLSNLEVVSQDLQPFINGIGQRTRSTSPQHLPTAQPLNTTTATTAVSTASGKRPFSRIIHLQLFFVFVTKSSL